VAPAEPPVLDAAQQAVVEHRGGPLLVLAGPGTGKTTTLVEAVVHRVEHDGLTPDQVLVLTFSRRAAAALRARIAARLSRTVREPAAMTFHAYAFGLLRADAVLRGDPPPRLLAGPEQDLVVRELLAGAIDAGQLGRWPVQLRPALRTRGFATALRDLLMRAVERGMGPDELAAVGRRHGRPEWEAAAAFFTEYEQVTALRAPVPAFDPAELVTTATDLLAATPELLAAQRRDRRVVFVDEYQDADPAQERMLELLAGGGRDLVVVGDPDQSIYGFRGSDVAVIRRFPDRFPAAGGEPARTLALTTSRRLGPVLLQASRRVAARLGGPVAHRALTPAESVSGLPERLDVDVLPTETQEAAHVAAMVRSAHLRDGVPWSSIAVLVRTSRQLGTIRRTLAGAGVPVAVDLDEVPFPNEPAVRPLLTLLEIVTGRRDLDAATALELVTGPLGGADSLTLRRLRRALRLDASRPAGERPADGGSVDGGRSAGVGPPGAASDAAPDELPASGQLLAGALVDPEPLRRLPPVIAGPAGRVAAVLAAGREAFTGPGATAETVLWAMWQASGLSPRWAAEAVSGGPRAAAADRNLDAVLALFDAAARFVDRLPAAGPDVFLDHVLDQQFPTESLAPAAPAGETVSLLTAHAAKGLEWDVVAVAGVVDGVWPDLRLRGSLLATEQLTRLDTDLDRTPGAAVSARLAEERRLFYVAVTRARRRLLVTAVADDENSPSRFLDDLDPAGTDTADRPVTQSTRRLDVASMVARLRSAVVSPAESPQRRQAAAWHLARLAAAGVAPADPANWYGLAPPSDTAPVVPADEPVRVSPSLVDGVLRCPLKSLLDRSVGETVASLSQDIGNVVHQLAHEVADGLDPARLRERLDQLWTQVDAGDGWAARKAYERARSMVDRLEGWLRSDRRQLLGAELDFDVTIGRARVTGRIDRLERDEHGRLVVIDFKTSKTPPPAAEVREHPQLGTYQAAAEAGAFDRFTDPGAPSESGGAALVQLGSGAKSQPAKEQAQPALADSDDPDWAADLLARAADLAGGATFAATPNKLCRMCQMRWACPARVEGGQVNS